MHQSSWGLHCFKTPWAWKSTLVTTQVGLGWQPSHSQNLLLILSWEFDCTVQWKITPGDTEALCYRNWTDVPWITFLLLRSVLFSTSFDHMLQILTFPSFNSYPHSKLIFIQKMHTQASFLNSDYRNKEIITLSLFGYLSYLSLVTWVPKITPN